MANSAWRNIGVMTWRIIKYNGEGRIMASLAALASASWPSQQAVCENENGGSAGVMKGGSGGGGNGRRRNK